MKEEIAEIRDVIGSRYIKVKKKGAWEAQINELEDGKYLIEVYWDPFHGECGKAERYHKLFNTEKGAQKVFNSLTINNMKKLLGKEDFK